MLPVELWVLVIVKILWLGYSGMMISFPICRFWNCIHWPFLMSLLSTPVNICKFIAIYEIDVSSTCWRFPVPEVPLDTPFHDCYINTYVRHCTIHTNVSYEWVFDCTSFDFMYKATTTINTTRSVTFVIVVCHHSQSILMWPVILLALRCGGDVDRDI